MFGTLKDGKARAGAAAEYAHRMSDAWSAYGRAEAGYTSGEGWDVLGMLGLRAVW